jgi:O-methyltransferase
MIKRAIQTLFQRFGYNVARHIPADLDEEAIGIIKLVNDYTATSPERVFALIQAVRYIARAGVAGSIVECGVWRGGSMMAVAHTLRCLGRRDIDLVLFDTYEGMTEPTRLDVGRTGHPAAIQFERTRTGPDSSDWCRATLQEVQMNLARTGYPSERIRFVKGRVEDTLPDEAPASISLLRLDTDWYASTRQELLHLYPRLTSRGVLIIDDYGDWKGSRQATDEYFETASVAPILLNRIDNTGRIGLKQ